MTNKSQISKIKRQNYKSKVKDALPALIFIRFAQNDSRGGWFVMTKQPNANKINMFRLIKYGHSGIMLKSISPQTGKSQGFVRPNRRNKIWLFAIMKNIVLVWRVS